MNTINNILLCRCQANVIDTAEYKNLAQRLKNLNINLTELEDLCAFAVHQPEELDKILSSNSKTCIIACYPRAVKYLLKQNGINSDVEEIINFRTQSVEDIEQKVNKLAPKQKQESKYQHLKSTLDVPAWYPVVDTSRCSNCGKCASFCLFGVYSFKKKKLEVKSPLSCKNNCPACGRTCPESAIMFPRLPEKSPLSGAEAQAATIQLDSGSLLSALQQRNKKQNNIFAAGVIQQAEEERKKALEEFKKLDKPTT